MKMLVVGPSPTKSKGGMATVIEEIKNDTTIGTGDNIINISGGVGSINIDFKE